MLFVSFEKQQLFCGPELIRDSGPGFWFNDGAGMLSEGSSTMTTPNMLKLKNRHDCRKHCKSKASEVYVLVKLFAAGRDSKFSARRHRAQNPGWDRPLDQLLRMINLCSSINRKTKSTFLTNASILLVKQFVHHHDQHSYGSTQDNFTTWDLSCTIPVWRLVWHCQCMGAVAGFIRTWG